MTAASNHGNQMYTVNKLVYDSCFQPWKPDVHS